MNSVIGFAGDLASFVLGALMSLAFYWFILSYWLDGSKLILWSVGLTFGFYATGALFAPDLQLGWRLLTVLAALVLGAATARYWLWRESQKYGPRNG